ncbi:ATP-dependent DNA helicase PIF1 [Corchorus olitorius]|uniref:ATP-dependent DNA helicase PIF1 n=1 Tax=Corchorus olitorius TaxID=93759 RepID=A0A1R3FX85_9ROSI|nr:ATP-dependent DNA helicase PIF1 [Corchorus olitorius]
MVRTRPIGVRQPPVVGVHESNQNRFRRRGHDASRGLLALNDSTIIGSQDFVQLKHTFSANTRLHSVFEDGTGIVDTLDVNHGNDESLSMRDVLLSEDETNSLPTDPSVTSVVADLGEICVHKRTCFEAENFGGPVFICSDCGASMWYDERVDLSRRPLNPKFNLCCKQDRISMPAMRPTPQFLYELLNGEGGRQSSKLREQI